MRFIDQGRFTSSYSIANQLAFCGMTRVSNDTKKLVAVVRRLPGVEAFTIHGAIYGVVDELGQECGCVVNTVMDPMDVGKPSDIVVVVEVYAHDSAALEHAAKALCKCVDGMGVAEIHRVREHLPVTYDQHWPTGTSTPGVRMISLCHRLEGTSRRQFEDYWTGKHAKVAMSFTVPIWQYSINVVLDDDDGDGNPPLDGILGMQFRTMDEWRDRYLGHPDEAAIGAEDAKNFMDVARTEMVFATERIVSTLRPNEERITR